MVIHRYFVVCLVGVWQRNFEPVVCVYGPASWPTSEFVMNEVPDFETAHLKILDASLFSEVSTF